MGLFDVKRFIEGTNTKYTNTHNPFSKYAVSGTLGYMGPRYVTHGMQAIKDGGRRVKTEGMVAYSRILNTADHAAKNALSSKVGSALKLTGKVILAAGTVYAISQGLQMAKDSGYEMPKLGLPGMESVKNAASSVWGFASNNTIMDTLSSAVSTTSGAITGAASYVLDTADSYTPPIISAPVKLVGTLLSSTPSAVRAAASGVGSLAQGVFSATSTVAGVGYTALDYTALPILRGAFSVAGFGAGLAWDNPISNLAKGVLSSIFVPPALKS